jgi:hypothetical protein
VEELKYLVLDIGKKYDLIKLILTKLSRIIIECMIYMNLSIKREDPTNFNTFVRNLIWFDIKQNNSLWNYFILIKRRGRL